jgi:hypothetical protein
MENFLASAHDLVTGSGILGLSSADSGLAYVAGGALAGVALAHYEVLRRAVPFAPALFKLILSVAQFFSLWEAKDPDVGAGLVTIPLFFVVCCAPVGSASEYLRRARLFSAALNAVVFIAAAIYYGIVQSSQSLDAALSNTALGAAEIYYESPQNVLAAAFASGNWLRSFLAVFDLAFAVSCAEGWPSAAFRCAVFVLLAFIPGLPRSLLRGPTPEWLMLLYGSALVQSAQVHSCALRLELTAVGDVQRALMLLVASALAVGYVERQGDPSHASYAALALLSAALLSWVAQTRWTQRED